jgi:ABC-2 type transport system permease protein
MDKVFAVIKREYLERVRSKWFIFATVFGPLLMAVLMFLPAWLATKTQPSSDAGNIVILDASAVGLGQRVADQLAAFGAAPTVEVLTGDKLAEAESTVTRAVMGKTREGYLVLDPLTVSGERSRYAGRNASTVPDMRRLEEAVKQAVLARRFEAEGLDPQRIRLLSKLDLKMDAQRLGERGRGGAGEGAMALAYGIALLLYMSIMLYGQAIMMGVIEEKSQRVAEVVVAAIPPDKLLAGKVLGVGAVGLTQQLVWVGSALTLMNFRKPIEAALGLNSGMAAFTLPSVSFGTALLFICFFILGYTLFATLFAAAGSMVSSTQDAQQVATPLVMLIIPSLLLLPPVLFAPNGSLARTVSLIPFSAPILMPVRMSLTTVSPLELVASLALLLLTCLGAMWLAARIYRTGVLMYGKKPTLREVLHWVRVAR